MIYFNRYKNIYYEIKCFENINRDFTCKDCYVKIFLRFEAITEELQIEEIHEKIGGINGSLKIEYDYYSGYMIISFESIYKSEKMVIKQTEKMIDTILSFEEIGEDMLSFYNEKILEWAKNKNLDKADCKAQMLKLVEESGELAEGIAKDRPEQIKDSLGDVFVVLTILAEQLNFNLTDCVEYAYNQIKDRKGKMINGVFVKEEDLKGE